MGLLLVVLLSLTGVPTSCARPAQVILLRHAEKPPDETDVHLSERGRERAHVLATWLTTNAVFLTNGLPVALFAPQPTRHGHGRRPYETLGPLAERLKLPIQTPFAATNCDALAERLLRDPACDGKTAVVCWVHDYLPQLAKALGAKPKPARWSADVYDRVWLITYHGKHASLATLRQHLM